MIVSNLPGVKYGGNHYRNLEREKISEMKSKKGFFDANMTLPERACCDFQWWCTNIPKSYNGITKGTSSLIIKTDAYKRYWAKVYEGTGTVGQFSLYDLST